MSSRIANVHFEGKKEKVNEYMRKSFNFVVFLTIPMMGIMILVAKEFVPIFYGTGYEQVIDLIKIISPILILIGLSNVIGIQYLIPTKQQKKLTISVIFGSIINIVLNYILILKYKAIGASIATIVAEFTVTSIQLYLVRKELNVKRMLKNSKNYIIVGLIMFVTTLLISSIYLDNKIKGIYNIIIKSSIASIIYIGILVIIKDKIIIQIKERILSKWKKKKN